MTSHDYQLDLGATCPALVLAKCAQAMSDRDKALAVLNFAKAAARREAKREIAREARKRDKADRTAWELWGEVDMRSEEIFDLYEFEDRCIVFNLYESKKPGRPRKYVQSAW